jgi:DNA-binding IclR family transcriptional regulator
MAALSFSVPAYRFREMKQAYRNIIVEAAKEISEYLGFEGRYPKWHRTE